MRRDGETGKPEAGAPVRIAVGDCRRTLLSMPSGFADCAITSPPYYMARVYGGDGEIGREPSPDGYVAALVEAFGAVRAAMRPRGTLWLVLGDRYARSPCSIGGAPIKARDLMLMPHHVASALRGDGWFLRSEIPWLKPNAMPERVSDRPVCAHETCFLLSPSAFYDYDAAAVREPATMRPQRRTAARDYGDGGVPAHRRGSSYVRTGAPAADSPDGLRHPRNYAVVPTQPWRGAHFAAFPERLVSPFVLAGCKEGGTVLDPFGGSGVTAIAAHRLGRRAVLCEANPEYAELAAARLAAAGVPKNDIDII